MNLIANLGEQGVVDLMIDVRKRKDAEVKRAISKRPAGTRKLDSTFHTYRGANIKLNHVVDALISAFEGGSNYWYFLLSMKENTNTDTIPESDFPMYVRNIFGDGELRITDNDGWYGSPQQQALQSDFTGYYEDSVNLEVLMKGYTGDIWILNEDAVKRGVEAMADKYLRHFMDMVSERGDADTGDVFLQCCLFGEIVFA